MKKTILPALMLFLLIVAAFLPTVALAEDSKATDVEIAPKLQLKGSNAKGKPPKTETTATGIFGTAAPHAEGRWAIVIGISDYAGAVNDLDYADDDALDMVSVLIGRYGFHKNNIKLLIDEDASSGNIIGEILGLQDKVREGDEVVFFYSGHGARGRANDGDKEAIDEAIVPYECTAEYLIWDGELKAMFSTYPTDRIVFIFDSCYSGGMTDLKDGGRIILMACSESALSYEDSSWGGGHGQFTYYLVEEGMGDQLADTNGENSYVTVEEAFDYAKASCIQQTPMISDSFPDDMRLS